MRRALKYVCAVLLIVLAVYGAIALAARLLTEAHGRDAGKALHPFVYGLMSTMGERFKKTLAETPDETLQKESEAISRKLYPIFKGALIGLVDAYTKDPNRDEVGKKMREAGRAVSEQIVSPFAEGVAEGSGKVVGKLDSTVEEIRRFNERHKDFFDSVSNTLRALKEMIDNKPPPLPQVPALPPGAPAPPQPSQPPDIRPNQR